MQKRILALLVSVLMAVSMLPMAAFAANYSDTVGHWANYEISRWSDLSILEGSDGQFRPDAPITRGEMAVILDRIMKYQVKAQNSFYDLGYAFYTDAILKANASGIIKGDGYTVRPNDKITREEAAVMLGRALGAGTGEVYTQEIKFTDAANISSWASGYVNAMYVKGYIDGFNGKFNPKASIKRAEVVKILDNAIKGFYNKSGTYTQDISGSVVVNTPDVVLKNITIKGNLIIAEGVGNGEVTLDNVKVKGSTLVRGGGENSIIIRGASELSNITIERINGVVSVKVQGDANVEVIVINDGSDDVNISGKVGILEVQASDITVTASGAAIRNAAVTGKGAVLMVDRDSRIEKLAVTAQNTEINVSGTVNNIEADDTAGGLKIIAQKGAVITNVKTEAPRTEISGSGKVKNAEIKADNVKVDTIGTRTKVDKNVTGTTSGGKEIAGGTSGTTTSGGGTYSPSFDD